MTGVGEIDEFDGLSPPSFLFDVQSGQEIGDGGGPLHIGVHRIRCLSIVSNSFRSHT